jgi:hypothetical protein
MDLAIIILFEGKTVSLASNPQNLGDQVSVFITLSDRVAQLYSQAAGSLFVALYASQGYGGGILTRLQRGRSVDIRIEPIWGFPFYLWLHEHSWLFVLKHSIFGFPIECKKNLIFIYKSSMYNFNIRAYHNR